MNHHLSILLLFAVPALLAPPLAWAQEPPSVPIEFLRDPTFPPEGSTAPGPAEIVTVNHGRVRSGWGLPVKPNEVIEFTIGDSQGSASGSAAGSTAPSWTPELSDGGSIQWTDTIDWSLPGGALSRSSSGAFRVRAPGAPGVYRMTITTTREARHGPNPLPTPPPDTIELTFLVMAPFDRRGDGMIGDYPIGIYPNETSPTAPSGVRDHQDLYRPPENFIFVAPGMDSLPISEHFTLGDFIPVMSRGESHFIAIDPRLIEFLEEALGLLEPLLGPPPPRRPLTVLSAFLSPNQLSRLRSQGTRFAQFNRYQYGDGAMVIWDADGDGRMDDLNRDGQIDQSDAQVFADHLTAVQQRMGKFGGIGTGPTPKIPGLPETPYVGIDMRGFAIKW